MEKNDYVICGWSDIKPNYNYEYDIIYEVTHNEAVDKAKKISLQQIFERGADVVLHEIKEMSWLDIEDAYDQVISSLLRFEVWKIDSNICKEAWDEFDLNPDTFCNRYCERVA